METKFMEFFDSFHTVNKEFFNFKTDFIQSFFAYLREESILKSLIFHFSPYNECGMIENELLMNATPFDGMWYTF